MQTIDIPIVTGPGSQPAEADVAELDILQLPSGMDTYAAPLLPEPEEITGLDQAKALLRCLLDELRECRADQPAFRLSLGHLDTDNRRLVDQALGEGEVSIRIGGESDCRIQESVLAGVWRVREYNCCEELIADRIEIGSIPLTVSQAAFVDAREHVVLPEADLPEGVYNAPPVIAEINDKIAVLNVGGEPHVINLTLLPQSEQDLDFLDQSLGAGRVSILSRGYGNCRISSTNTENVWWVRYYNAQDKNILNSLEVTPVPGVACAAQEDLEDSAERLAEILEIYL